MTVGKIVQVMAKDTKTDFDEWLWEELVQK